MNMRDVWFTAIIAAIACSARAADTALDQRANSADQASGLQEIVVTAEKRGERLQDVPISITALTGSELDQSSVQGVSEALRHVPGVAAFEGFEGGGTQVVVRGVTASNFLYAGPSPIAYYLDAVPFGLVRGAIAPDISAYDLDRVEVLRGPQGTLYGASALNGVVRVLTKSPDLNDFDLTSRVSTSNTDGGAENYRGDVALNIPIVDGKLAARLVAGYQDLSGWIDSPDRSHVNSQHLQNYRLKILGQPTDELSIELSAFGALQHFDAPSTSRNDGTIAALGAEPYDMDYEGYGLDVKYDAPGVLITSNTSLFDFYNQGILDLTPLGNGDQSGPPTPFVSHNGSRTWSEELLLSSKSTNAWRWSVGGFYRHSADNTFQYVVAAPFPEATDFLDYSRSYAVFGELGQRFLSDALEWTLGARYFHDDVSVLGGPGIPSQQNIGSAGTFEATTPRAVLTWHVSHDLMMYGSYSQGFRSGWPQNPSVTADYPSFAPVKPDKLSNYELGAKGDLFEHRVSFDAAVYYMDWHDIQQALEVPYPSGLCCLEVGVNGNSASGIGADLGLTVRPLEGLELGVNLSWNDLALDNSVISGGTVLIPRGERPNFSPQTTASTSVAYTVPLIAGYTGTIGASASYVSQLPDRQLEGTPSLSVALPDNSMTTGRVSLMLQAPHNWSATLYADNVNNYKGSPVRIYEFTGMPDWDVRLRPRTVGLQFDYRLK
jgi:outer membrane receptor protein involved in Fe transport